MNEQLLPRPDGSCLGLSWPTETRDDGGVRSTVVPPRISDPSTRGLRMQ